MMTAIFTTQPGVQIHRQDLQLIRSRLKSIKKKFQQRFHNKALRFLLSKPLPLRLVMSTCVLHVSIERCGCGMRCALIFIHKELRRLERGLLSHLSIATQEMTGIQFKKSKCRIALELGIFYRDEIKCVKRRKRVYDLRPLPVRAYTA